MYKYIALFFSLIFSTFSCFSNPIDDIEYKKDDFFNFFIEIPAGTSQKWEINKSSGDLEWDEKKGKKRIIQFLPYPGNYGFIPQTLSGDKDPIDLIMIDEYRNRGSVHQVKIIGGLFFKDKKELDIKLIGVSPTGVFKDYVSINDLFLEKPEVLNILKIWFESYKKQGKMVFYRYIDRTQALNYIEEAHLKWKLKNTTR